MHQLAPKATTTGAEITECMHNREPDASARQYHAVDPASWVYTFSGQRVGRGTNRARQSALAALVGVLDYMLHHGQKIFVGKFFAPDVSGQAVVHGREQLFGGEDGVMPNKWARHSVRLSQDSRISIRMPIHVDEHSSRLLLTHRSSLYNIPNALTGKYIDRNATHICTKSNLALFSCPVTPT